MWTQAKLAAFLRKKTHLTRNKQTNKKSNIILVLRTSRTDYIRINSNSQREKCQLNRICCTVEDAKGRQTWLLRRQDALHVPATTTLSNALPSHVPCKKTTIPSFLTQGLHISPLLKTVPSSNITALIPYPTPSTPLLSLVFTKMSFCINGTAAQEKSCFEKYQVDTTPVWLQSFWKPACATKETENHPYYYRLTCSQNWRWSTTVLILKYASFY